MFARLERQDQHQHDARRRPARCRGSRAGVGRSPKAKRAVSQLNTSSTCPTAFTCAGGGQREGGEPAERGEHPRRADRRRDPPVPQHRPDPPRRAPAIQTGHQQRLRQRHAGEREGRPDQEAAASVERQRRRAVGDRRQREGRAAREPEPRRPVQQPAAESRASPRAARRRPGSTRMPASGSGADAGRRAAPARTAPPAPSRSWRRCCRPRSCGRAKSRSSSSVAAICATAPPSAQAAKAGVTRRQRRAPAPRQHGDQQHRPGRGEEEARIGGAEHARPAPVSAFCSAVRRFCRNAAPSERATQSSTQSRSRSAYQLIASTSSGQRSAAPPGKRGCGRRGEDVEALGRALHRLGHQLAGERRQRHARGRNSRRRRRRPAPAAGRPASGSR